MSLLHTVIAHVQEEVKRGRRRDPQGRRVGPLAGGLTPATGPAGPIDAKTLGCMFRVFSSGSGLVAPYSHVRALRDPDVKRSVTDLAAGGAKR